MSEQKLKTSLAFAIVCIHVLVFVALLTCKMNDWFTSPELKMGLSLAAPTFASSVALVVKYAIDTRDRPVMPSKEISGLFGGLTILFLVAITGAIAATIFAKARGLIGLSDFSLVFGAIESLLAVYFGQLTVALFQLPASPAQSTK